MNLLAAFIEEVVQYLTRSRGHCDKLQNLIKFRECYDYDFSFPLQLEIWKNYMLDYDDETDNWQDNILKYAQRSSSEEYQENFKTASATWTFSIKRITINENRCSFTIDRPSSYLKLFEELTRNNRYGKCDKVDEETVSLETIRTAADGSENSSISEYRVELVSKIIRNLLAYSRFNYVDDPSVAAHKILVTTKSNLIKNHSQSDRTLLICGVVTNLSDKKLSQVDAHDYIAKRSQDMHLTSIHRYGVRARDNDAFTTLIKQLGRSAVTLDLLEVKPSSSVMLTDNPNHAFILYNSARLETLLRKFQAKVQAGYYVPVPDISEIQFSLLKEEEEWQLFKLLLTFPDVIKRSIHEITKGKVSIHIIHKYIQHIFNIFSIYYRRVRLLTENRPQMICVLHAKIFLLNSFQRIVNETLAILCIDPIAFM